MRIVVSGVDFRKQPWPGFRMGIPAGLANLRQGSQEGEDVTGRKPGKHLVAANQRPSNGGRWSFSGRSFMRQPMIEFTLKVRLTFKQAARLASLAVCLIVMLLT